MKTVKDYIEDLTQLLPSEKKIVKSKKKKVQESSYERELLQSLQEAKKPERYVITPQVVELIFGEADANIVTRVQRLQEFIESPRAYENPKAAILYIDILNEIKNIIDFFNPSSAGFEMEHLISQICKGRVIDAAEANSEENVTDIESGNNTAYSLKTIGPKTAVTGSINNFKNTIEKTMKGEYSAFYYIIIVKNKTKSGLGSVTFKQIEIVGPNKKRNEEKIKLISTSFKDAKKLQFSISQNIATEFATLDVSAINEVLQRNSNDFIERIEGIRNEVQIIESQMKEYLQNTINNPKKAKYNLGQARKSTQTVTDHLTKEQKASGK